MAKCPLTRGVRLWEVSVSGGLTVGPSVHKPSGPSVPSLNSGSREATGNIVSTVEPPLLNGHLSLADTWSCY